MSIKTFGSASYVTNGLLNYFTLPDVDSYNNNVELYRLGNVVYNNETEVQRVDRSDFYNIDKSKLTKPSTGFPVYLYESNFLYVKPTTITSGINVDFVKKPSDVIWGFTVGSLGQYINNTEVYNVSTQPTGSLNFELQI